MVYFAMALALFAEEDYEEVAARLTETLASWAAGIRRGARPRREGSPRPVSGWGPSRWSCLEQRGLRVDAWSIRSAPCHRGQSG